MRWLRKAEAPQDINTNDLVVSFNEAFFDYYIPAPWDQGQYITYVGDFRLGFGPRYLLGDIIEKIQGVYSEMVPSYSIQTKPIPELTEPIVRRLGKQKYKGNPEKELEKQRSRFWLRPTIPYGWDWYAAPSTVDVYKWNNRPEENFEVSHL